MVCLNISGSNDNQILGYPGITKTKMSNTEIEIIDCDAEDGISEDEKYYDDYLTVQYILTMTDPLKNIFCYNNNVVREVLTNVKHKNMDYLYDIDIAKKFMTSDEFNHMVSEYNQMIFEFKERFRSTMEERKKQDNFMELDKEVNDFYSVYSN